MAECKNCGHELEGKRIDAKYCSDICRVIFNRNIKVKPVSDNVTDKRAGIDSMIKPEITAQGNIRVSKPGDSDYVPMCETTKALLDGKPKITNVLKFIGIQPDKRGKDIKCFEDLPVDVQEVIHRLSTTDGKIDQTIIANRTAIAVNYQHQFPDRFHSTGVN